jgi:hypothetical protein
MKFIEFQAVILFELKENPAGFTWKQLKVRLDLPYNNPCPTWVKKLEEEIGLQRVKGKGRALVWKLI